MDSRMHNKPTAQSGGVEEPIRHLTSEDLEGYFQGRLSSARLDYCRTHLDSCEACRAELEDLRTFKSDSAGFARSEPDRRKLERGRRRRRLTLPQAAAIATIIVAASSAVLWWGRERPRANKTSVAVTTTHSVLAPVPTARIPAPDTRLADEISALPADVRPAVSEAIQRGKLPLSTELSQFRGRAHALLGAAEANTGFALLRPVGEAISETRPEFRWQPLAGAIRYSVAIVDERLHPVLRSPALRTTGWRPRRPLHRGKTYLWQVTATLRGGSTVVASAPEALRIIPNKLADELAQFRRGHEDAHLVLGTLYAQAGMLTESADELRKVLPSESSYSTARTLLESLPSTLPGDTSRVALQSH
jgi:predicted anti-sigma-YlaC factor YlaD